MRTTTITCDRCTSLIEGNHSVVAIDLIAGELKTRRDEPRIELCVSCGSDFMSWLRSSKFELMSSEAMATV
jgi:hypothetical protein